MSNEEKAKREYIEGKLEKLRHEFGDEIFFTELLSCLARMEENSARAKARGEHDRINWM